MQPQLIRNYINMLDALLSEAKIPTATLLQFKSEIAARIKELPADDASMTALREIEDLLKHVNAGGRMGIINGELKNINDPTVDAAHKELSRFILSIPQTPEQRTELFKLWKADKLLDYKKMCQVGTTSFATIIAKYHSNPLIKELVNELMKVSALGQGKGEFGLSVLSKNVSKQDGKGDLSIAGRPIEVKTTDGGAGRFTDQEVRPANGFEKVATELNKFVSQHPTTPLNVPASGLNLTSAVAYYEMLESPKDKKYYLSMVEKVITLIMGGTKTSNIDDIIDGVKSGDSGKALQGYAKASFDYYMSKKKDDGVLYINVAVEPITTVFFKTADDLSASSLRFHAKTPYITATKDHRLPYPQIEIVPTTFGANALVKQQKVASNQAAFAAKAEKLSAKLAGKGGGGMTNIRPPGTPTRAEPKAAVAAPRQKR